MNFPFLDEKSGIVVDKNEVKPLIRNSLNVEHPSMILVGLSTTLDYGVLYYDQVAISFKKMH